MPPITPAATLGDPTFAYILMAFGVYALIFEVSHPGAIAPGVLGALALGAGLVALAFLPVNLTGLALVILGFSLLAGEVLVLPGSGILAAAGLGALVVGSLLLSLAAGPAGRVALWALIVVVLTSAGLFALLTRSVLLVRRRPIQVGRERLLGAEASALTDLNPAGQVRVHGETWHATVAPGFPPIRRDERVFVVGIEGLTLSVAGAARVLGAIAPEE